MQPVFLRVPPPCGRWIRIAKSSAAWKEGMSLALLGIFADSAALRAMGCLVKSAAAWKEVIRLDAIGIFAIFSVLQATVLLFSADRNAKERQFLLTKDPDCKTIK